MLRVHDRKRPQAPTGGFFHRSMKASVFLGLLGGLFAAVYAGYGVAGRYLLFLGWMLANLFLWAAATRELLGRKRFGLLAALGVAKILWLAALYGLCVGVGIGGWANFLSFFLGLNTPFLVMFLKALGLGMMQPPVSTSEEFESVKKTKTPDFRPD